MSKVIPSNFSTYVIMPFGNNNEYLGGNLESDFVYHEIIKPAVKLVLGNPETEPNIIREIVRNRPGLINESIINALLNSDLVIADITGRNPNVFMELGIRYSLRNKITIMIAQEGTEIPFNIHGCRHIEYNRFQPDVARRRIAHSIREGLKEETYSDSVVYSVFPQMSVVIPGILETYGLETPTSREIMRWDDYIARIEWVCDLLREPHINGRFRPDAVFGISNGGLIVADLIGREIFRGTPILSLWANRFTPELDTTKGFFDNEFNDAEIKALQDKRKNAKPEEPATILIVDDHLGTGQTALQAITYVQKKLKLKPKILFIPLVSPRIQYYSAVEQYLPYNYPSQDGVKVFNVGKEEFVKRVNTEASFFPYFKKEISKGP